MSVFVYIFRKIIEINFDSVSTPEEYQALTRNAIISQRFF